MTPRIDDQRTLGEDGRPLPETSAPYAAKVLAERLVEYGPEELAPYHRNPRRGDVDSIAASLRRNGQYRPIVVNLGTHTGRPLEVLAGNHTLAAARQLGWDRIAATTVDVNDHQAARIVAADNRTADLGGYDEDVLLELLQELPDLDGTGYNDDDLTRLLEHGTLNDDGDGTGGAGGDPSKYTLDAKAPQYEPTATEPPPVSNLYDNSRARRLQADIAAAELPDDVREFLNHAAQRHVRFNYRNIAEFYAHSGPALQRLFEASALVIIDPNDAINLGYLKLTTRLHEIYQAAYPADVDPELEV